MMASTGPLKGVPVHMHMNFPPSFPESPPTVRIISDIDAPFKIGDMLCIDMLRFSGYHGVRHDEAAAVVMANQMGLPIHPNPIHPAASLIER